MYRIKAVAPDTYIVQKKRWYGLYTCCLYEWDGWADQYPAKFQTIDLAKRALWDYLQKQRDVAAHLAQFPIYTTGL